MGTEPPLEFSDHAKRRMCSRGITEAHVWYCIHHHSGQYDVTKKEIAYVTKLPDGRNIKVRVRDGLKTPIYVIDAFSFQ